MITNERKQIVCEKYDIYLRIINDLGNKIMLQKQLVQIAIELGIAKTEFEAMRATIELEQAEIIKKIKFSNTNNKFILFKKYAIRYLAGANDGNAVAGLTTVNSNKRYVESIMYVEFILRVLIPSAKKAKGEITYDTLLKAIDEFNCNILYKANDMEEYYKNIWNKNTLKLDKEELENDISILLKEKEVRIGNLRGVKSSNINKKRKNKEEQLYTSNLATLARKNIFIANMNYVHKVEKIKIIAYYFNIAVDKNTTTVALNYSITYNTLKRLFGGNIILEFKIVVIDKIVGDSLIKDLNKRYINPRTKERTADNYLSVLLKVNGLNEVDFTNIKTTIIDYNIDI
ncbi:hypothetical protein KLJ98_15295 [Clostridioides difficile]|nr:hypothetical protein [Clostridioides difficile]MDN9160253.1 hypothetical protein [Clostridioides difficile]